MIPISNFMIPIAELVIPITSFEILIQITALNVIPERILLIKQFQTPFHAKMLQKHPSAWILVPLVIFLMA